MMKSDQRRILRYPVNQPGELHFAGHGRVRVKVLDISLQGAGVVCELSLPMGARGELSLMLVGALRTRFIAEFAITDVTLLGVHGYRIGLGFAPLVPAMNDALIAFGRTRGQAVLLRPD